MKIKNFIFTFCLILFSSVYSQNKFIVVLDAGHGGHDPGCIGQKKTKEKEINLAVALKLGTLIEKNCKDVKVVYTRKNDVFVPLINRAKIANDNKGDLFISIHCDAVANKNSAASAFGVSTFTMGAAKTEANLAVAQRENSVILMEENYETTYQGFDPKSPESYIMFELLQGTHQKHSIEFAQCIQKEVKERAKRNDRSVRQTPALVLKEAGMPAVLVEIGFLSNLKEEAYLVTQSGQNALANSIYHGFMEYKKMYDKQNLIDGGKNVVATQPVTKEKTASTANSTVNSNKNKVNETTGSTTSKGGATDKKNEVKPNSQSASSTAKQNNGTAAKKSNTDNAIVYKIQFMTSPNIYKSGASQLKGIKNTEYYKEGTTYKYTVGSAASPQELSKELKEVKLKFKDAFIIKFSNGKRIK